MSDVDAYRDHREYLNFQSLRPDYTKAIRASVDMVQKYVKNKKGDVVLADFCCGTGNNTKDVSEKLGGIKKAVLVDVNKEFLDAARDSGIEAEEIEIIEGDVLAVSFRRKNEADIVLSIFAYHHIQDEEKEAYLEKILEIMKSRGILVLTEIYFDNKASCLNYYKGLFDSISGKGEAPGLKEFLEQTAKSSDFEFKVSKGFADAQLKEKGFRLLEETKIWPTDHLSESDEGTFVQVYSLD